MNRNTTELSSQVDRRVFLRALAAATAAVPASFGAALPEPAGIVDTHTHFYDPTRPGGVSWPPKEDGFLHRTVLPPEYVALARPLGIVGTVVVEASPAVADNAWLLELARLESFLPGIVGHLKPGRPGFAEDLERYAANPLFKGARVGGWDTELAEADTAFGRDLGLLAARGLVADMNFGPSSLPLVARLAAAHPSLRIVINHCAGVRIDGKAPPPEWLDGMRACAARPNVFMKVSGLVEATGRRAGDVPEEAGFYRPVLDPIWAAFGEDRVLFGSNWPVSARFASLAVVVGIAQRYAAGRGRGAAEKLFSSNARRVYRLGPA